jgi:hypothetical protein
MKNFNVVGIVTVLTVVFLSLSPLVVLAQYETQQTAEFTVSSDGTAHVDQSSSAGDISIDIAGTLGATGLVTTATYNANPQPGASIPDNVVLTRFIVVTFDMSSSDFINATITISYSDADVGGMSLPYVLYKYNPNTNSFVALESVLDTSAKTITVTLTSTTDPLFAIGSTVASTATPTVAPTQEPASSSGVTWAWIAVGIEIVVGVILGFWVYFYVRRFNAARSKKFV